MVGLGIALLVILAVCKIVGLVFAAFGLLLKIAIVLTVAGLVLDFLTGFRLYGRRGPRL